MDPVTVAAGAAVLLASKGGEALAGEAGKAAWAGLGRLWELVRAKFAGDPQAERALAAVEAQPGDAGRVQQLAESLVAHARSDPQFEVALQRLVADARQDPAVGPMVVQVHDYASIGKVVTFGTVHGDVSF